jgi:hypothetical protein
MKIAKLTILFSSLVTLIFGAFCYSQQRTASRDWLDYKQAHGCQVDKLQTAQTVGLGWPTSYKCRGLPGDVMPYRYAVDDGLSYDDFGRAER